MIFEVPDLLPFAGLLPILASVAIGDMREFRIANSKVLVVLAFFVFTIPFVPAEELLYRISVAALSFLVCFALYAWGKMGGGDAKLIPALLLFVPAGDVSLFLFALALGLAVGIASLLVARHCLADRSGLWPSFQVGAPLPVGLPIALAGVAFLLLAGTI